MERDSSVVEAIPVFSKALEEALSEIVASDKLDSPDFNPIDYINETFPKESSLGDNQLNEFLGKLRVRVVKVSDNITKDVREFSTQRTRTKKAIGSATEAIGDLFTKIKAIKEKAAKSEEMVEKICRDIKSLDYAKRHLTDTIRAMRNLHMLVSAVEQLDHMVAQKQYRDVASMLRAINDLLTLFVNYKNVKNIKDLQQKVDALKENIKSQIFEDYNTLIPNLKALSEPKNQKTLNEACLVVDAFEPHVRKELLNRFTRSRLGDYIQLFAVGNQGSTLDQTDRRYEWLRRELEKYEQHFQPIFPENWDTPAILSYEFCTLTKSHLADILKLDEEKFEINILLRALQSTLAFERELSARFRGTNLADHYEKGDDDLRGQGNVIRAKYTRLQKGTNHQSSICFDRLISDAFTPYMGRYVELERSNIKELISRIGEEEKWEPDPIDSDDSTRLMGSDELFLYIKKSIKRCSRLTKGIVLFQLFNEYKRGLALYVDLLSSKLPRGEAPKGGSEPEPLELSHLQVISTCLILNTAEYCNDTIPSLEESIKKLIHEEFNEKINLEETQEHFFVLINTSANVIVQSTMKKMDRTLVDMSKKQWATWNKVGDQSDYVNEINRILQEDVPVVAQMLSGLYHTFFCTQLVNAFIPKYTEAIYNCKRIGEMGGQQLALDAHALKHCLLNIPEIGKGSQDDQDDSRQGRVQRKKRKPNASRLFKRYVKREMGKAEALLKILVSPIEQLIHTWRALLPKSTLEELSRIMNLRGLKKAEQQQCVDEYNSVVGVEEKIDVLAWKAVLVEAQPIRGLGKLLNMSAFSSSNLTGVAYGANH